MPTYEYVCIECGERMEIWATISKKERGLKVACPKCGSKRVAQVFGNFTVIGSSKGKNSTMCSPKAGPGCCG